MFKKIIIGVLLIVLFILGYCGFIPGLSSALRAEQPRDLGIKSNDAEFEAGTRKAGITFEELPPSNDPEKTLKFSGKTTIGGFFTSEEITSILQHDKWKYNFIPTSQIRFNADGTMEIAGKLYADRLPGYTKAHHIPTYTLGPIFKLLSFLPGKPPLYIKVAPKVVEGTLELKIIKVQIGKYTFPAALTVSQSSVIAAFIEKHLFGPVPNLSINSLAIEDGRVNFDGTFPDTIAVSHR